jgi:hypothetical protein
MVLPLWFLLGSLVFPRVCLFFAWYGDPPFNQMETSFVVGQPWSALLWVSLARILVLIVIQDNQGFSVWFFTHLVALVVVWFFCWVGIQS